MLIETIYDVNSKYGESFSLIMDIEERGKNLLQQLLQLENKLDNIPNQRRMIYREEIQDGKIIGKPRFEKSIFQWPQDLLQELREFLQNIWNFFEDVSYWFDYSIYSMISEKDRRISKKSIIFLLEQDVWCTDEIFGDYLIEESKQKIIFSYYRRNTKIRSFEIKKSQSLNIKEWICNNTRYQIQEQFLFLWKKLETEISICISEKYKKIPRRIESSTYLLEEFQICCKIQKIAPEASLLSLGRIAEHWLLLILKKDNKKIGDNLIREAELMGFLTRDQTRMFRKINRHYNKLKHNITYSLEKYILTQLIEQFSPFLT